MAAMPSPLTFAMRSFHDAASIDAEVQMGINLSIRPGARNATSMPIIPPSETPASEKRSSPAASATASTSSASIAIA